MDEGAEQQPKCSKSDSNSNVRCSLKYEEARENKEKKMGSHKNRREIDSIKEGDTEEGKRESQGKVLGNENDHIVV